MAKDNGQFHQNIRNRVAELKAQSAKASEKVRRVEALIARGATAGEREAARAAYTRLTGKVHPNVSLMDQLRTLKDWNVQG